MHTPLHRFAPLALALLLGALPMVAQAQPGTTLPNFRPYDQDGVNVFEAPKHRTDTYTGPSLRWGVAFAQQFQALSHSNEAEPVLNPAGANVNELITIGNGFNLATANLNLDAILAEGIRVNLITYLSSRHHPEAWVKGGYVQVDAAPMLNIALLDEVMRYTTVKLGHFEINYGDAHFRRTDNGNAMYNPFVGNLIMDAFTTEIGGEVYVQHQGFLGMVGITGGEIQGSILRPDDRAPSFYGKLGVDRQINDDLRVRLTGSGYTTSKSLSNSLYGGDRAGSRYYLVMEPVGATPAAQFTSGRINPGMRNEVTALMLNPFVKFQGFELFGTLERATGSAFGEAANRTWNQLAVEGIYRFLPREQVYVGARYNTVSGPLAGTLDEVTLNRVQVGAGWFATPSLLLKGEYVNQNYNGFPASNRFHGGGFNGFMIEGVLAF
jgi:hypothetical protein